MFPDFRKIENLHILLWLLKDICWVADLKWMGTFMIFPTISVAIWLTWKMRKSYSELMHNLAVIAWILANSVWMIGEFFFDDGTRPIALLFFGLGLVLLFVFYGRELILKWGSKKTNSESEKSTN
ncbi:hypothetical protein D3C71_345480 [compost metagenome]